MTIQKPRVLIVEDHAFVRESLGIFLELFGYQVASACGAIEALTLAQAHKLDVLLFDVYLPEPQDGWELLRELRRQELAPLLNISMSAYLRNHERERSNVAGCQAHLVKPFRMEDLEKALRCGRWAV